MYLSAINRFPVKSCRGASVPSAVVEPWGLVGDRRWLVVDAGGRFLTAREHRRMLLVHTSVRADGGLDLASPDAGELSVDIPAAGELVPVQVWDSKLDATPAAADADAWFSEIVGRPARLVYLDDPTRRPADQDFGAPDDRVSFADGFPLLLTTSASLDALNGYVAAGPRAEEGPLSMIRFRPNVVIDGSEPWAEDGWRLVRIGPAIFRSVSGCARCAIPLTDPDTVVRGKEPIASLARHRRFDGETWFGMNLIPDTPGVSITVGDEVEILESVPAPNGPPR